MPKTQRRRWRSMHPMDFSFVSLSRNVRLCDRSRGTGTLARVPLLCSSARLSDSNLSGSRSCQRALVASLRHTAGLFFVLSLRRIYPTATAAAAAGSSIVSFFSLSMCPSPSPSYFNDASFHGVRGSGCGLLINSVPPTTRRTQGRRCCGCELRVLTPFLRLSPLGARRLRSCGPPCMYTPVGAQAG